MTCRLAWADGAAVLRAKTLSAPVAVFETTTEADSSASLLRNDKTKNTKAGLLFGSQGFHGFYFGGSAAGNEGGGDCGDCEDAEDGKDHGEIGG